MPEGNKKRPVNRRDELSMINLDDYGNARVPKPIPEELPEVGKGGYYQGGDDDLDYSYLEHANRKAREGLTEKRGQNRFFLNRYHDALDPVRPELRPTYVRQWYQPYEDYMNRDVWDKEPGPPRGFLDVLMKGLQTAAMLRNAGRKTRIMKADMENDDARIKLHSDYDKELEQEKQRIRRIKEGKK